MSYAFGNLVRGGRSADYADMSDSELDALIASRFDEDAFFNLDNAIAFQPPSLPQWFVNGASGLGDALSFGLTRRARGALSIDGGVDTSSTAYTAGSWGAVAVGGGRLVYMGAAKGYSMIARSGAAASAFREGLKRPGRLWFGRSWRQPDLSRYGSDAALRSAAGRTNPYINVYGAGVTYSGATGPCYSDSC